MDVDQTLRAIKVAEEVVETLFGGAKNLAKGGAFLVGMGKGALNLGKKAIGAMVSGINSNHPVVKQESQSTLESAATVKMSLKDLQDISASRKLNDPQYQKIAKFTDNLEAMGVAVDGSTEIAGYKFNKSIDKKGANIYQAIDAKTGKVVAQFSQTKNGKIAIGTHLNSKDALLTTIEKVGKQLDFDLNVTDPQAIAFEDVNQNIDNLDRQLIAVDRSIDNMNVDAETDVNTAVKTSTQIKDIVHQLFELEDMANRLNQSIQAKQNALNQELQENPAQQAIGSLVVEMMAKQVRAIIERVKTTQQHLLQKSHRFAHHHQLNIPSAIDPAELERSGDLRSENSGGLDIEMLETAAPGFSGNEAGASGLDGGNISLPTPAAASSNSQMLEIMSGVTAQVTPGGAIGGSNVATAADPAQANDELMLRGS
jgi:ribosomal protein L29